MAKSPVVAWKPLGELLVERGVLTTEELDAALEEQEATGELLGAILVARKAVPSVVLTTLLAEQVGVELETQGGFGSGLFSKIAERHGTAAPSPSPQLPAPSDDIGMQALPVEPKNPACELSALRAELELLRARNAQLEAEVDGISKKLASRGRAQSKSA